MIKYAKNLFLVQLVTVLACCITNGDTGIVGTNTILNGLTDTANRIAVPVIMPENGFILNISMYHQAGTGDVLFGIYANDGPTDKPGDRLALSASTPVAAVQGWQTVELINYVYVEGGSKIWIAWVYENNPGIRYEPGSPGRAISVETWPAGMPEHFGESTIANFMYSIYATYTPSGPEPDTTPPTPDPMDWKIPPYSAGSYSISMVALEAIDPSGVQYYFEEVSDNPGGSDSDWQDSRYYTDTDLLPDTQYRYRVMARDKSYNQNQTEFSSTESVSTDPPLAEFPLGDLNQNCNVSLQDLLLMAEQWLDVGTCSDPTCADLDENNSVNIADFAMLAYNWLTQCPVKIMINEFMASNDTIIIDPQGQYDDWIEIYNPTGMAIDIGGLYITDNLANPDKWQIPPGFSEQTTIAPYDYLLLWADDDTQDGPLHLSFELSASNGEAIGISLDGVNLHDSIGFGPQITDKSYGRYPDATDNWYNMDNPTPQSTNTVGTAEMVRFSRHGCAFADPLALILSTCSKTAQIYYTLDGTEPSDTSGILYTSPITITDTTWVRARAYDAGLLPGPVLSHNFIALDSTVQSFESNLPLVVIDTFGFDIYNEWEPYLPRPFRPVMSVFIETDEDTNRADILDQPDFAGYGGLHIRGSSSAGYAKKQFAFEVWDEYDQDKNASLLGFPPESDWILCGPYSDKTLMRNYQMYTWDRSMGNWGVGCRFVEMFLDIDGGKLSQSDYVGVYVLMEKIKRDENRINVEPLETFHDTEPEITGGYILKKDWESNFETDIYNDRLAYVYPDSLDITDEQEDWLLNYLNDFEAALAASNFDDPVNGYAQYIDPASFIDHHILVELAKNVDGFVLSTFLFKDRSGKLNMGPIWDYNGSLGGADYFCNYDPTGWLHEFDENTCVDASGCDSTGEGGATFPADNPNAYRWYQRLFEDPEFALKYADRWFQLREDFFANANVMADIDYNVASLTENNAADNPVTRNFNRWNIDDQTWPNLWDNCHDNTKYEDYVNWMRYWLTTRLPWMDGAIAAEYAAAPPIFNQDGGNVAAGFSLTIAPQQTFNTITLIPAGALWSYLDDGSNQGTSWRTDKISWPSGYAELGYGDGDEDTTLEYGPDPGNKYVTTYFRRTFNVDDTSDILGLTVRLLRDDGAVVYINGTEVWRTNMPDGTITYTNYADDPVFDAAEKTYYTYYTDNSSLQNGDNIIAVEIHQCAPNSSDISFNLELKASVAGSGTGTVYYTTDGTDPRLHGGGIAPGALLYDSPVTLTESAVFKARAKNAGQWSALNEAAFAVGPVMDNLRITEIMYHPAGDPNTEFVELQNIGTETINLNRVSFTNGIYFTFPSVQLAQNEYALVVRSESAFETQYGTGLNVVGQYTGSLDNAGEKIRLQNAVGQVIHEFRYDDDWYPVTDGSGFSLNIINPTATAPDHWNHPESWQAGNVTGGTPQGAHLPNIVPNGAIVINEILTHTDDLVYGDWIELYNTTASSINIGGWFISDDRDNLKKYEIQLSDPRAAIPANGYVVFYSQQDFRNPYDPGSIIQFGLSELGEQVYLSSGSEGELAGGYSITEDFDAAENGITLGRYIKSPASGYDVDFVAMASATKGAANSEPKVDSVVINEIMYNPYPDSDETAEYIELKNVSGSTLTLYDPVYPQNTARFTDGIDFTFPTGVTLSEGEYLLVVRGNPDVFRSTYGIPPSVQILGPFQANTKLDDGGEKIELSMPGHPETGTGLVPYIRIDRVKYSDGRHPQEYPDLPCDPWPAEPDGQGYSLAKIDSTQYGNDVANWTADTPTPGEDNFSK